MGLRCLVKPTVEPVTLEEARAHVQIVETWQDLRLSDAIRGARDQVERYCQRALLTQTWEVTAGPALVTASGGLALGWGRPGCTDSHVDDFTHNRITCRSGAPWSAATGDGDAWAARGWIELPYAAPFQAMVSVQIDGLEVPAVDYAVDLTEPARLYLAAAGEHLRVQYVCGVEDPADVPPSIKEAVYLILGTGFTYREGSDGELPLAAAQRLDDYALKAVA